MADSFSTFFYGEYFYRDQAFQRESFRPKTHRHLLYEMVIPGFVYKAAFSFNSDTKFLEQFPERYRSKALWVRHRHDLYEALVIRDKARRPLFDKLYKKFYDEAYQNLLDQGLSGRALEHLSKRDATRYAEEEAAKNVDGNIQYPEWKVYKFRKLGRLKHKDESHPDNFEYIRARPYIKELIWEYERDMGDVNGFDLAAPREANLEGKKAKRTKKATEEKYAATRGMTLMSSDVAKKQYAKWLNYIGHRMLTVPEEKKGNIEEWSPHTAKNPANPRGMGSAGIKDTFTIDRVRIPLMKKFKKAIPTMSDQQVVAIWSKYFPSNKIAANKIKGSDPNLRKLAGEMAWDKIKKMISDGKIRTPPIPGFPQGKPLRLNDNGEIVHEDLFLPKEYIDVQFVDGKTGQLETRRELATVLAPGNFLKHLSPTELARVKAWEKENGVDGVRRGSHYNPETGEMESEYIAVEDHPLEKETPGAQGSRQILAGATAPNQNSTGRKPLPRTHVDYVKRFNAMLDAMKPGDVDADFRWTANPGGNFYKDIVHGINTALNSGLGGATNWEVELLSTMRPDIHNMVLMNLIDNLDEPMMWKRPWRVKRAKIITSNLAQQDWDFGTRRKRGTKEPGAMDSTGSLEEFLDPRLREAKLAADRRKATECHLSPGEHNLPGGLCQFTYDISNLFDIVGEAELAASKAEAEIKHAEETYSAQVDYSGLMNKKQALRDAFLALFAMYVNVKTTKQEAEHGASDIKKIEQEAEQEASAVVAQLAKLKTVNEVVQTVSQLIEKLAEQYGVDRAKIDKIKQTIVPPDKMESLLQDWKETVAFVLQLPAEAMGRWQSLQPTINELVKTYPFMANHAQKLQEDVHRADSQFKASGARKPQLQPQQMPNAVKPSSSDSVIQLYQNKEWVPLLKHPRFESLAMNSGFPASKLLEIKSDMQADLGTLSSPLAIRVLQTAIAKVDELIKKKSGGT